MRLPDQMWPVICKSRYEYEDGIQSLYSSEEKAVAAAERLNGGYRVWCGFSVGGPIDVESLDTTSPTKWTLELWEEFQKEISDLQARWGVQLIAPYHEMEIRPTETPSELWNMKLNVPYEVPGLTTGDPC